jgi:hypothetical protein
MGYAGAAFGKGAKAAGLVDALAESLPRWYFLHRRRRLRHEGT